MSLRQETGGRSFDRQREGILGKSQDKLRRQIHDTERKLSSHVALLEWNKWVKLGAKLVRDQAKACDLGFIHS